MKTLMALGTFGTAALALVLACSSRVTTGPGGGSGGSAGSATTGPGGGGAAVGGGGGSGGGGVWTECSSPDGYRICGGPAACPVDGECTKCVDEGFVTAGGVSACLTPAMVTFGIQPCWLCPDGSICASFHSDVALTYCAPFNLGVLYDHAGVGDHVRYADYGLWTGAPLPTPDACPVIDGVDVCGGHCGGCPPGFVCTGRAPLHPYGMCVADNYDGCALDGSVTCQHNGHACFVFQVEPAAQALADQAGYCMPLASCQSAAANLPGGGKCVVL